MRALSHIRRFQMVVFPEHAQLIGGVREEIRPAYIAQFTVGDLYAHEKKWAEQNFNLHGRTYEADEVTPTAIEGRLSTYDTSSNENQERYQEIDDQCEGQPIPGHRGELWQQGTCQRLVEERLRARASTGGDYIVVEEIPVNAPWPTYDEFQGTVTQLVQRLIDDRHHLPECLLYEKQNQNREDVVISIGEAMEMRREAGELVDEKDIVLA